MILDVLRGIRIATRIIAAILLMIAAVFLLDAAVPQEWWSGIVAGAGLAAMFAITVVAFWALGGDA